MEKVRRIAIILATAGVVIAVGCAHTKTIEAKVSVMKQSGGTMLAVSSSTTEAIAYDGAKEKAEEYCWKQQKDFVVVKEESAYQGGDRTAAGVASAVGTFLGKKTRGNLDDYKVKMIFKCEGNYTGHGEPFAKTLDLSTTTRHW
ncbi:MAG: hypothetical protein HY537_03230 [Deltaproteobacteria bacterium]|nr:hypothetical protein [Deltaproteobacteria bacterium]